MPLSARMLELSTLEVLLAIAKTGSLSAAGRELGLTQQAVSVRLHGRPARRGFDVLSGKRRLVEARVLRKRHPQQYVEHPDCTDARRNTGVLAEFDEPFVDPAKLGAERFPESRPVAPPRIAEPLSSR
jgi:hypothetical protein